MLALAGWLESHAHFSARARPGRGGGVCGGLNTLIGQGWVSGPPLHLGMLSAPPQLHPRD